jgi:hypothetical protein
VNLTMKFLTTKNTKEIFGKERDESQEFVRIGFAKGNPVTVQPHRLYPLILLISSCTSWPSW